MEVSTFQPKKYTIKSARRNLKKLIANQVSQNKYSFRTVQYFSLFLPFFEDEKREKIFKVGDTNSYGMKVALYPSSHKYIKFRTKYVGVYD